MYYTISKLRVEYRWNKHGYKYLKKKKKKLY